MSSKVLWLKSKTFREESRFACIIWAFVLVYRPNMFHVCNALWTLFSSLDHHQLQSRFDSLIDNWIERFKVLVMKNRWHQKFIEPPSRLPSDNYGKHHKLPLTNTKASIVIMGFMIPLLPFRVRKFDVSFRNQKFISSILHFREIHESTDQSLANKPPPSIVNQSGES